jgi:hypothetical protein
MLVKMKGRLAQGVERLGRVGRHQDPLEAGFAGVWWH